MHDFLPDLSGGPEFSQDLNIMPGRLGRFCKGGAPQRNKKLEAQQMALMQAQLKQAQQKIEIPEMAIPEPAPPDPPPPGQTASDSTYAEQDARRLASRRNGIKSTILSAGATAGSSSLGGSKTLLGGAQ